MKKARGGHRLGDMTALPRLVVHDPRLSLTAVGMYGYLCTLDEGEEVDLTSPDPTEDIPAALQELVDAGFIRVLNSEVEVFDEGVTR